MSRSTDQSQSALLRPEDSTLSTSSAASVLFNMESTTGAQDEKLRAPKPRFFNPQPVHLDYMNALDSLRASRSPSGASSVSSVDPFRVPATRDKIYEAAKDYLPPDSAFFTSGEFHIKEKPGCKPFVIKNQAIDRDLPSAEPENSSKKIQHKRATNMTMAEAYSPQTTSPTMRIDREQDGTTVSLQGPHRQAKKRKMKPPSSPSTRATRSSELEVNPLEISQKADAAIHMLRGEPSNDLHLRKQSAEGSMDVMCSSSDCHRVPSVAMTSFQTPSSSPTCIPTGRSSVPATHRSRLPWSEDRLVQTMRASMYPVNRDASMGAATISEVNFDPSQSLSTTFQPFSIQNGHQDMCKVYQGQSDFTHSGLSAEPYENEYAPQVQQSMQIWDSTCTLIPGQNTIMEGYENRGDTSYTYAPFGDRSSPVPLALNPLSHHSILQSGNQYPSSQIQQHPKFWPIQLPRTSNTQFPRGLSPERSSMPIANESSLDHVGTQFSQPTVPDLNDFEYLPTDTRFRITDGAKSTSRFIHHASSSPFSEARSLFSTKPPQYPEANSNSPEVTNHLSQNAHPEQIAENVPVVSSNCDVPCDGDCDSLDCTSCDGSEICCKPCTNPDMCSSGECDDLKCFEEPHSICTGHHTPSDLYRSGQTPVSPEESYVNPRHLLLDCHWETLGQQCEASMPSFNSLSQHVLMSHIQPQKVLPCKWNRCSDQVEVDEIPNHVWHYHSPTPQADSYICLWQGCGQNFLTTEDLDVHMKSVHCRISCHWDGCEQATTSEVALKAHVDKKHISKTMSPKSTGATPSAPSPDTPHTVIPTQEIHTGHCKSTWNAPILTATADELVLHISGNAGEKICQWVGHIAAKVCGETFSNGNELQAHIEEAHLDNLKALSSPRACLNQPAYTCLWQGCKNKGPFSERSKLARHIYIHSRYMIGACRHCGKEFNSHNQLNDHERTHTKEKPFNCGKCGFKATNKAALNTHIRTHSGKKPLKCDKCLYTCGDPSNMSKHRKIHDAPLHKCELCEKSFCRMATLKRHMLSH